MNLALLANIALTGWTFGAIAKAIVVILIVVGIVWVVIQQSGITIPPWLLKILGLLVLGVVAILSIELVLSL